MRNVTRMTIPFRPVRLTPCYIIPFTWFEFPIPFTPLFRLFIFFLYIFNNNRHRTRYLARRVGGVQFLYCWWRRYPFNGICESGTGPGPGAETIIQSTGRGEIRRVFYLTFLATFQKIQVRFNTFLDGIFFIVFFSHANPLKKNHFIRTPDKIKNDRIRHQCRIFIYFF